jgi:glutaredoxin|tara:strand:- start:1207 stop:1461 length:255 start_codon:yes stop_codon:yes gene_type:complete
MYKLIVKNSCPFCVSAISLLKEKNLLYSVTSVDGNPELLREAKANYNWQTVPIITKVDHNGTMFIGGYTDLKEHLETGKTLLRG